MENKIKAVLFDMDGTLVRMDDKEFTENYLARLCAVICPLGYGKEAFLRAVWAGVEAMVGNDGQVPNSTRFWDTFSALLGEEIRARMPVFEHFYSKGDFLLTREITKPNPKARILLDRLHEKGVRTVLATNPLLPECAQATRLSWADLTPDDFEWISHYDNSYFCKPSPEYYREILTNTGLSACECLMVGNSVSEDVLPAEQLGIKTFLVTEYAAGDVNMAPRKGDFTQMMDFVMENI